MLQTPIRKNIVALTARPALAHVTPNVVLRAGGGAFTNYVSRITRQQVEGAPVLREPPARAGQVVHDPQGHAFVVPEAVVATRPEGRDLPHVSLRPEGDAHVLNVVFNLRRPPNAPDDATLVPLTDYRVTLVADNLDAALPLHVEPAPPPEDAADVMLTLHAHVSTTDGADLDQLLRALQDEPRAHFKVEATAHYRTAAAASASFQGTWNSTFGELRLLQSGSRVWGDYADKGSIDGRFDPGTGVLDGTFTNGNQPGRLRFKLQDNGFQGAWAWGNAEPSSGWEGTRTSAATPTLRTYTRRDDGADGAADPFVGTWVNADANTRGITRFVVRQQGTAYHVHMWGKCSPRDCDWGETAASKHGSSLTLQWSMGHKTEQQTITPVGDGQVQLRGRATYTRPGRAARAYTETFKRSGGNAPVVGHFFAVGALRRTERLVFNLGGGAGAGGGGGAENAAPGAPRTQALALHAGPLSAYYPVNNPANRRIYSAVDQRFAADPDARWVQTPEGLLRESPLPNQYYILPDAYGLAFDLDQQLPSVTTLLIQDEDADGTGIHAYRIRVRLSVIPFFDPERLRRLRAHLDATMGRPYPTLVVGGYEEATFALTRLLDDLGLSRTGGESEGAVQVDAARGFEVVLDCTSQAYNLLQRFLVTSGVQGDVTFKLRMDSETVTTHGVPMRLKLAEPAAHPLTVDVVADPSDGSPDVVTIHNPAGFGVRVGGIDGTLLVVLDGSAHDPVDALEARAHPATLELAPGARMEVELEPAEASEDRLWGAVAVQLTKVQLDLDPDEVLQRIHELTPTANVKSIVRVWSYLLAHPEQMDGPLADVYGVDVELQREGTAASKVTLTRDNPEAQMPLAYSFADLLAGRSPGHPTFAYRQRTLTPARQGEWSAWETVTGRDLQVAPVVAAP